ncbi:MAG: hypothetical protein WA020_02675, partial [Candidatus Acidiferrales bacterium]
TRTLWVSTLVLIVIGSVGFLNLSQRPRFQAFRTVDVLQLLATGMCYGVALAGILALRRKPSAQ